MTKKTRVTAAKVMTDCALCEKKILPGAAILKDFKSGDWAHKHCVFRGTSPKLVRSTEPVAQPMECFPDWYLGKDADYIPTEEDWADVRRLLALRERRAS